MTNEFTEKEVRLGRYRDKMHRFYKRILAEYVDIYSTRNSDFSEGTGPRYEMVEAALGSGREVCRASRGNLAHGSHVIADVAPPSLIPALRVTEVLYIG